MAPGDRRRPPPTVRPRTVPVLDVGCGVGWSSVSMAAAYPLIMVDGVDPDVASVEQARRNALEAGVEDRVRFHVADAATAHELGPFDFTGEPDPLESYFYGWSLMECLPAGMWERPSAETGAVMRPETLRGYAREAGFATTEVLAIPHETFHLYLLRP